MKKNVIIQQFISEVEHGVTPSKETLKLVAEILKPKIKKKPGPKEYLDKSFETIEKDWEMVEYFLDQKEIVGREESIEITANKYEVSERTVERKIKKLRQFIEEKNELLKKCSKLQEMLQNDSSGFASKSKIKSFRQSIAEELNKK